MPGPTRRVNKSHALQAELVDRRLERPVEYELLNELRGLKKGVLLPRRLGKVLIEVTKEARVPCRITEVMDELSLLIEPTKELDKAARRIPGNRHTPHRVRSPVKQSMRCR